MTLPLALLGDKLSPKVTMYIGVASSFVVMIPLVMALEAHSTLWIYILVSAVRIAMSATWAPLSALMTHMFKPEGRYTSISLGYGIGAAVFGGLSPLAASSLYAATGNIWSVVGLFGMLSVIAWVSTMFAPQYQDDVDEAAPVPTSSKGTV